MLIGREECNNPTVNVAYKLIPCYSTNNVEARSILELPKMGHIIFY